MSKVVVIGIDGLDPYLLGKWKDHLPHFSSMFNDTTEAIVKSTFPPDSVCAWTSIYTGENPAEHGLIESIDYLSGKKAGDIKNRSVYFQGKTFWDIAGNRGKKVCVLNPFIAYPAWKVNGVMVSGPVFEGGETSAYPDTILSEYCFPQLGGMVDFPDERNLEDFLKKSCDVTQELADVGLKIYQEMNPDLFFLTFLTLDRIKHFLWRFTDEGDRYYAGETVLKDSIKDFYSVLDKIVGGFKESLSGDSVLLVVSDHGHGRRCVNSLNLNELFRRKGYLEAGGSGIKGACKRIVEKMKVFTVTSLSKYGYQDWIYKIARFIPHRKSLKKSTYLINKEDSPVLLSNICGTNPYGGVDIQAASVDEFETLREAVISELLTLNETYGKDIIKWAKKREQVYSGKHEGVLPDILFELNEEYGVGMDLYVDPVTDNYTHKKISGGHKRDAVLLQQGANGKILNIERPSTVEGVKDFILQILEQ
jgi:predicted AlkP superfamily phosphohydrolase/phosphomutase